MDAAIDGGGFAAARQILAAQPQLPVIMLADPDTNELLRAVRLGVIGYLVKGTDDRTPTRVVRAAIAGEAVLPRRLLARLFEAVRQPGLTRQVGVKASRSHLVRRKSPTCCARPNQRARSPPNSGSRP